MRTLLLGWLGGFLCGAAAMLGIILWVLSDTEGFEVKRFPWPESRYE